ncbi:MAG: hypothetical protein KC503_28965 [Myxococcales bacterium]|nr:hypothetical protein [Myxococcales bacterium]
MSTQNEKRRIIIMGAAGRDFHNFNTVYRDDPTVQVVAFTATQIPGISGRTYPPTLSGELYPSGIPIVGEEKLAELCREHRVHEVVFSYSDVPYDYVMRRAAITNAAGASFTLLGGDATMLDAKVPVVAVCAVRTGCGKSQSSRYIARVLRERGLRVVVIRHPMPYGDLARQAVQRFASMSDITAADCTIEEREEYEPHVVEGIVVYAGVDYARILAQAQAEADIIIWDGGNNDTPFYRPNLWITVADPLRVGDELSYYPGETNLRAADIVLINKVNSADPQAVETLRTSIASANPDATVIAADSTFDLGDEARAAVHGKRVLTIEDGPTVTHGEMAYGAAQVAARELGAAEIVEPRGAARGSIAAALERYAHLDRTLPALGYSTEQVRELEQSIAAIDCDAVLYATPIDLEGIVHIEKPAFRVRYELNDRAGEKSLASAVHSWLDERGR